MTYVTPAEVAGFKVGDRVRSLQPHYTGLSVGALGTVARVGFAMVEVRWDGDPIESMNPNDMTWPMPVDIIEKEYSREEEIEPAPSVFYDRLMGIVSEITLAENFRVLARPDSEIPGGRWYFQIQCWRKDVITGEMGYGYGGKAYLSEHATDSELVQTIFGLYKGYWEHEARESFQWRGRRVFGPHIATEALWEIARRVDVRSAKHEEDQK